MVTKTFESSVAVGELFLKFADSGPRADFGGTPLEPEIVLDERRHEYHTTAFAALAYLLRHFFRRMRGETTNHFGYVSKNDGSCAAHR